MPTSKLIKYADLSAVTGAAIYFLGEHASDQMRPPYYVGNRFDHRKISYPSLTLDEETELAIELNALYANYDSDSTPKHADICEAARRIRTGLSRRYDKHQLLDYLAGVTLRDISGRQACFKRVQTSAPVPGFGWAA